MKALSLISFAVLSIFFCNSCVKDYVEPDNCQTACNYQQPADNCGQQNYSGNNSCSGNGSCENGNNSGFQDMTGHHNCSNADSSCINGRGDCRCDGAIADGHPGNWCSGGETCSCKMN